MLGALIGAGTSLLGGFLSSKSNAKAAKRQEALQREFAQNGIQWKVEDAKKAGVHPLYALGANTVSYSPTQVGDTLGPAIADAGQNLGRAVDTGRTTNERATALSVRSAELGIQRQELENTKLASEIALLHQPGSPPPPHTENPIVPGQGVIEHKPSVQTSVDVGAPWLEASPTPEVKYSWTPHGELAATPAKEIAEALESSMWASGGYGVRNHILPSLGQGVPPPAKYLPKGATHFKFNPFTQAWRPVYPKK